MKYRLLERKADVQCQVNSSHYKPHALLAPLNAWLQRDACLCLYGFTLRPAWASVYRDSVQLLRLGMQNQRL